MEEYTIKDIVAQSYLNIDFPAQYVATMHDPRLKNVKISDFYNAFCTKNSITAENGKNAIFQPALILGYLYTTFLLPQQSFFNIIPEDNICLNDWGITIEIDNNYSLKHVSKRMRNSLGHNRIIVTKKLEFTFWDAKPKVKLFSEAEAIYKFDFDGLMFKFIPNWNKYVMIWAKA